MPGSAGQAGTPVVLGDVATFNGAGSFPGAPLLRAAGRISRGRALAGSDELRLAVRRLRRRRPIALRRLQRTPARQRRARRRARRALARVAARAAHRRRASGRGAGRGRVQHVRERRIGPRLFGPVRRARRNSARRNGSGAAVTPFRGRGHERSWRRPRRVGSQRHDRGALWYARSRRLSPVQKLGSRTPRCASRSRSATTGERSSRGSIRA